MSIDVRKPSDAASEKPKLSRVGIISVALLLILGVVIAGMVMSAGRQRKAEAQRAGVIDAAIDHAIVVCRGITAASGDSDDAAELARLIEAIGKEKNPLTRAEMATDMISACLLLAHGRQDQIDELNGARNRILVATRAYNQRS